ncbi:MAG: hypothetical protein H0A75_07935 [Candidatus Methanofishera endochildressiae]|uniref:Uncharacterized protein n=1 Tax=Candidatus Methanofishera endochildressiae TaxID=2738884 RepID=A0A7Z0SFK5_9GAMM|nr:hypothetical protein [Candidatus Methanofishera endochildressiae]
MSAIPVLNKTYVAVKPSSSEPVQQPVVCDTDSSPYKQIKLLILRFKPLTSLPPVFLRVGLERTCIKHKVGGTWCEFGKLRIHCWDGAE